MERIAVQSREIALVGYENQSATLEVTFRRGGVYHYFKVQPNTFDQLMKAPSLGTYFAAEIKDKYSYKKVC